MPIEHLPPRYRSLARRIRRVVISNTTVMVLLGLAAIWRGAAYLGSPPASHPSELWLPIATWAVIWIVVGVANLVCSWAYQSPIAAVAVASAVSLNAIWAGSLLTSPLIDYGSSSAWGGASAYALTAVLVPWAIWRGNKTEFTPRGDLHARGTDR